MGLRRPRVLALIDLVQDIDVLLPVLIGMKADMRLRVRVSHWLREASPRTAALLKSHAIAYRYVHRPSVMAGRTPTLSGVDAVLLGADSGALAHLAGHALARRAAAAAIPAYVLQNGVHIDPYERATGAARYFLGWSEPPDGAPLTPEHVTVGRPRLPVPEAPPAFDIGVFENLHWERYRDDDRDGFLKGLMGLAEARPNLSILVRAHPAGGWLDQQAAALARFAHVTFEPSTAAGRRHTAGPAVAASVAKVITTPSTVALDSALANRPVALTHDGGVLFSPLPVLITPADWMDFADHPCSPGPGRAFAQRMVVEGDAVARIVRRLKQDLS